MMNVFRGRCRQAAAGILAVACLAISCKKNDDAFAIPPEERYSGGPNLTTFDRSDNAFGAQAKGLTFDQEGRFVSGNSLFRSNWVTAPASVMSLDGLGPLFNSGSCGGCHFKDGRAQPPASPDAPLNGLLFRLGLPGGHPEPLYADQLQDKAVLGVLPEARVSVAYMELPGAYPDGIAYTLRKPVYTFDNWSFGAPAADMQFSPRIAPQLPGLGLLEAIDDAAIEAGADPADVDSDGISGRANFVWDAQKQMNTLGRFGWKANQPSLNQQTAAAFVGDIGITSSLFPVEPWSAVQIDAYGQLPNGGSPELSDEQLARVVFYMQALSVPARRDIDDPEVARGQQLFGQIGCDKCHRQQWQTGNSHPESFLNTTTIYPYTDLLLHDMGPELADGKPDFEAEGSEWRTPPLWGIGMIPTVNKHFSLLHDGRARNPEEAILWHGGEAETMRDRFKALSASERAAVLRFLESL